MTNDQTIRDIRSRLKSERQSARAKLERAKSLARSTGYDNERVQEAASDYNQTCNKLALISGLLTRAKSSLRAESMAGRLPSEIEGPNEPEPRGARPSRPELIGGYLTVEFQRQTER